MSQSKLLKKFNCLRMGLSMVELLIVVAILSLLILAGMRGYLLHLAKARDATRKSDLNQIKVAFAEYLGDYGCFPTYDALTECESDELAPYLDKIPCDPKTLEPYFLDVDHAVVCPRKYRVLADLEIDDDPVIAVLHCDGEGGCGGTDPDIYNYGVADGVPVGNVEYLGKDAEEVGPTATSVPQPPTVTPLLQAPTATSVPQPPTATPILEPTVTSTPVYTHCCPLNDDSCDNYDPAGGGNCDGTPYTSLYACMADPTNTCNK